MSNPTEETQPESPASDNEERGRLSFGQASPTTEELLDLPSSDEEEEETLFASTRQKEKDCPVDPPVDPPVESSPTESATSSARCGCCDHFNSTMGGRDL